MAAAKEKDKVRVHYTGKLEDGTVFDSSVEREPVEFTIGEERLIAGFEKAVLGMEPGENKVETVAAGEAYGPFRDELVQELSRQDFPGDVTITQGQRFEARTASGQPLMLTVVDVADDKVTVDANHPLAGKDLVFEIELLEIL
ncbi:MAG: peptidylprolyl isomerase [Candidatus Hydrogenedentes bacterium]|nr:peptidylprolyl isomerase [Candidatus Hydrogenedentota bacterium]